MVLVEDESLAARRLQKILGRLFCHLDGFGHIPFEALWCDTPEAALEAIRSGADLIFLDLNLGGFNAFTWIEEGQIDPAKTIIISADTRHCDEAMARGIFAYVPKPIDEDLLKKHLERFIRDQGLIA